MKHLKSYNESIRDKMTGKSVEHIEELTSKLPPQEKVSIGIEKQIPWLIEDGIKGGFDIKKDFTGYYLYKAGEVGNVEIIEMLLNNGADIHADNDIVFRRACSLRNLDVIKLLIDRGANIHIYDDYFLNPQYNWQETIDFIKKHSKITESLRDKMIPKSEEELKNAYIMLFNSINPTPVTEFPNNIDTITEICELMGSDINQVYIIGEEEDDYYNMIDRINELTDHIIHWKTKPFTMSKEGWDYRIVPDYKLTFGYPEDFNDLKVIIFDWEFLKRKISDFKI